MKNIKNYSSVLEEIHYSIFQYNQQLFSRKNTNILNNINSEYGSVFRFHLM